MISAATAFFNLSKPAAHKVPRMQSTVLPSASLEPRSIDPEIDLVRLNQDMVPQKIAGIDKELAALDFKKRKLLKNRRIMTRILSAIEDELLTIAQEETSELI